MFRNRPALWALVSATVSSLFAVGYGGGCYNVATQGFTDAIRPCAILDCTNGLLGGAINPCGQLGNPDDDVFVGCP